MITSSHATVRNTGAIVAVLIATAFIGVFALMVMGRDEGGSAQGVATEPAYTEPALPQDARYPQPGDKFAPERIVPTPEPPRGTTLLMACYDEGLAYIAKSGEEHEVISFCRQRAYPAGKPDESEPMVPTGRGSFYAALTR